MSDERKTIDWNKMSELGLLEKINTEILHPIGLAISRNPENGFSEQILISNDGTWEYCPSMKSTILSDDELKHQLSLLGI